MPIDPTLGELSEQWSPQDIASMTHGPAQPNPVRPYVQAAPRAAFDFAQGGLTGIIPDLHQDMPSPIDAIGRLFQGQTAHDALSVSGGVPAIEAFWSPRDLGILKKIYSANIDPNTFSGLIQRYFPERSIQSIRNKAFELGLKRPEIPPYVRQPGSPSIANDPARVAQIKNMLKRGLTFDQMAAEMGDVSARSIRRYVNENLKTRLLKKSDPGAAKPSMPSFNLPGEAAGDPEYEKALLDFLQGQQSSPANLPEINVPGLEELFDQLTTKRKP